jgi:CheY-like chemotaxis protein
MKENAILLIAEDDDGHFSLIVRNLARSGIINPIVRFKDGQETLDYLNSMKDSEGAFPVRPCVLILDIRMPKIDGLEILAFMKNDDLLRKMPVIVLTTSSDQEIIDKCQSLGCDMYVVKPVEYEQFIETITRIGHFLSVVEIPILCH